MSNENNKMQVDIENLFKQNVNDLSAIKELYRKFKEVEEKISQIKYIDSTLANKLKKEYEKLKKIILDENVQAKLTNDIETINSELDKKLDKSYIETINSELDNKLDKSYYETINSELDNKANLNSVFGMANMGQDIKEAMTGGSVAVVGKNAILRENIVDGQITFEKLDPVIKNEYDEIYEDEPLIQNNGYIAYTGVVTDDNGWKHYSGQCIPNFKYKVTGQSWLVIPLVMFRDKEGNVLSYFPTNQDSSTTNYNDIEVVAPINATEIIIHRYLSREFGLKRRSKITLKPLIIEKPSTKLTIIGDSLSADDSPQAANKYHALLSQNDGYIVTNLAKGGHGYKRADDNANSFWQQATKIPSNSDIVFVFGSFNDLGKVINGEYTIGESVDNASTSTNTIMECVNKTITNIRAIKNDAIIVIASPTPWSNYHTGGGANKDIAEQYVKAIETVAHNQCCIFLDLFHESNVWSWNNEWNNVYCPDGVHPNDLGHKRYLYPIIRDTLNKVNPNK